jgi:predicted amidophosphoribosyltransferase
MTEPVAATPAPDVLRCPSCGAEVRETERFCEACGAPLSPTVDVVDEAVQAAERPIELSRPLSAGAAPTGDPAAEAARPLCA